ncbi:4'-phosphopantetheinyl transferase superfamily protein [Flavobacterium sp. ZT3R17]|uniref:4'-phosphopantetheinyl transferase family protein n=1 Tax=Flavobacterium cryoconiti TaxID=3398736 RepID=UPI003A8A4611
MIGNDIVDLTLARKESNWKRKGFLDKIFTQKEQLLILNAINPEVLVWNLWSRKEAAYKIYNRESGIRAYIPLQLECHYENEILGTVICNGNTYFTQTNISEEFIHSIAVVKKEYFNAIKALNSKAEISKINGIPFIIDIQTQKTIPVSISHHGRFWEGIKLLC